MTWNPQQYHRFATLRARPADDLVARLPPDLAPRRVIDLGCGGGRLTRQLARRWPEAEVIGVDGSAAMLAEARAGAPGITWVEADLARWQPPGPAELIIANAALHWLGQHEILFPTLMTRLAPGGVLAVQMPRNDGAPSHTLVRQTVAEGPWAEALAGIMPEARVAPPEAYLGWLGPVSADLDLWECHYYQRLEGPDAVLEWLKGTTLVPLLARLQDQPAWLEQFLGELGSRLRQAYPPQADGRTVFPFRRLFLIARAGQRRTSG